MWELLYEEFWDKLEHFCYKLCRDDGRAEDLTQEVFLRALQNQALMESFAPGQCKAWLFAAARNLYCDQVRRAVKEESLLALLDPDDAETPDETAEAALTRGVKVTGATVHYVNEIPDGGRILLQKAVEVLPDDTPQTLQRRVMEQAEWILLPQAAEMVAARLQAEKEGSRA